MNEAADAEAEWGRPVRGAAAATAACGTHSPGAQRKPAPGWRAASGSARAEGHARDGGWIGGAAAVCRLALGLGARRASRA